MRTRPLAAAVVAVAVLLAGCSDDDSGSAEELCAELARGNPFTDTFEGFDPTDVDAALDQLREARVALGELREAAPDEVEGDLDTEIDYLQALIDALEEVDPLDPPDAVNAVQRTADQHREVQEAADRLAAWADTNC